MNLLFWNLKSNSNLESIIADCISENDADIVLLSEHDGVNFNLLIQTLSNQYTLLVSFGGCDEVRVLYKKTILLSLIREQNRYLLAKFQRLNQTYLLVGVHLPSNTHGDGSSDRKNVIRKLINDVVEAEKNNIKSSIIIGDMNASPFDAELIEKDAFNSVLFKRIINQQEFVAYQGDSYRRFYNPIIEYINETNQDYGSFYYGSGNGCLYWYCYDQLLVRKGLIDNIIDFKYLKQIKQLNLMNRVRPNRKISDHLPLLVELDI